MRKRSRARTVILAFPFLRFKLMDYGFFSDIYNFIKVQEIAVGLTLFVVALCCDK